MVERPWCPPHENKMTTHFFTAFNHFWCLAFHDVLIAADFSGPAFDVTMRNEKKHASIDGCQAVQGLASFRETFLLVVITTSRK